MSFEKSSALASPEPERSAVIGSPGPACDVCGGPRSPQEAGNVLGRLPGGTWPDATSGRSTGATRGSGRCLRRQSTRCGGPVMQRRTFLAMVSGGLFAAPLAAEAQQPEKIPQSLLQRADQVIE